MKTLVDEIADIIAGTAEIIDREPGVTFRTIAKQIIQHLIALRAKHPELYKIGCDYAQSFESEDDDFDRGLMAMFQAALSEDIVWSHKPTVVE